MSGQWRISGPGQNGGYYLIRPTEPSRLGPFLSRENAEIQKQTMDRKLKIERAAEALYDACGYEEEINDYIESCDLADDTKHPLWKVVKALRAARKKATG